MSRSSVWERWESERIARSFRGVRTLAATLGFVVGAGLTAAAAHLLRRVAGG